MRRFLSILILAFVFATPALADAKKYSFDKNHTQILFFVGHMGFSHSNGKFLDFDGSLNFDEADPTAATAEIVIKTDSINMDDEAWDKHLKSKDFFNVEQFPTMSFKSTSIEKTGDNTAKMTGDLTLLGQTHPLTLDVTLNKCDVHAMTKQPTCGFDLRGTIKRSEWGMSSGIPMVSDDVELRITVEASVQPELNP